VSEVELLSSDAASIDVDRTTKPLNGSNPGTLFVWVRRAGYGVLGLQFIGLVIWSHVLASRFALTWDFSIYHQAWWLIGAGHLNPFDTLNGFPFWQNHGEFLLWPLAVVGKVWPHAVTLLWVQDAATVGAEAVAFGWLCDFAVAREPQPMRTRWPALLAGVGIALLVADPWIYWALSFDFHLEMVAILFAALAARSIYRDPASRRVWLWVALTLASGDVATTYLLAIGVTAAIIGKRWRRTGLLVTAAALAWAVLLVAIGANKGSGLESGYGYLAVAAGTAAPVSLDLSQIVLGLLLHPLRVVDTLWSRRLDIYGAVAPGGLIGFAFPWVIVAAALVVVENGLNDYAGFIVPGFQDALLFVLVPVGTVALIALLARRHPRFAGVVTLVVAANALAWGTVWIPRTASQWLRVSPAAAQTLDSARGMIPSGAEVIASQGITGRFSGRRWNYAVIAPTSLPVHTSPVWVIVAPRQGIETVTVGMSYAFISELAGPLHARLELHRSGIWVFRWVPAPGTRSLLVPNALPTVAGWTVAGPAGSALTVGPVSSWRAVATGKAGYVVAGDYWRELPGLYQATAVLSSTVPVNVEVWNATGGVLLARRSIPPTNGTVAVTVPVDADRSYPHHLDTGAGLFRISPIPPPPGDQLEIRVWTPGAGSVTVSSLELEPAGKSTRDR